jgi:hypothetical protein
MSLLLLFRSLFAPPVSVTVRHARRTTLDVTHGPVD